MIEPIRVSEEKAMILAGFDRYFKFGENSQISGLWSEFVPHIGKVPGRVGDIEYGLCHEMDGSGFHYLASVEVANGEGVGDEYIVVRVPAQKYAVFLHKGHVSQLSET